MKKIYNKKWVENIIIFIFLTVTFISISHHELWRDEAQQWLLIKNLNIIDLIAQLKVEGHPFVWYLLLKIFNLLGFSYQATRYIPWTLCGISSIILIKKVEMNTFLKAIILSSVTFLYYCSVISRSYSLLLLEIILLIFAYKKRKEKPVVYNLLLAITANTHILTLGFVGALFTSELFEIIIKKDNVNKKRRIASMSITIFGIFILFMQLMGSTDRMTTNTYLDVQTLIRFVYSFISIFEKSTNSIFLENVILLAFIYFICYLIYKKNYKFSYISVASIGFQMIVFTIIKATGEHMVSVFFAIMLFVGVMLYQNKNYKKIAFIYLFITFAATIPLAINLCILDYKNNYSNSYDAAMYISKNINQDEKLYCDYPPLCSSIEPYIKNRFIYSNNDSFEEFTFIDWRKMEKGRLITTKLITDITKNGIKYVIATNDTNIKELEEKGIIEVLYSADSFSVSDEQYIILKIISNR